MSFLIKRKFHRLQIKRNWVLVSPLPQSQITSFLLDLIFPLNKGDVTPLCTPLRIRQDIWW